MINIISKLRPLRRIVQSSRNLHITHFIRNAYEGPGKTTVTFLTKEVGRRLLITHCDEIGFSLNNTARLVGPAVIFPTYALSWNIMSGEHINETTLSLFTVLEPKPDLLIIGLDDTYDFAYIRRLQEIIKRHNINAEIVSVFNACTVFNFVNEEGRYVAAALIPPKSRRFQMLQNSVPKKQISNPNDIVNSEIIKKTNML